jgi:hypothetical protein
MSEIDSAEETRPSDNRLIYCSSRELAAGVFLANSIDFDDFAEERSSLQML